MPKELIEETELLMDESIDHLANEFKKIRTGRANASMVNSILVQAYGTPTPLNQIASISTPEARQLLITPFDRGLISITEKSIRELNLPVSLMNDGNNIRLTIAPLTEETRKTTVKEVGVVSEQTKIGIRNKRRDANDQLKKLEKNKEITEDEMKYFLEEVQKITNKFISKIDVMAKEKEEIVMKV